MPKTAKEEKLAFDVPAAARSAGWSIRRRHDGHENTNRSADRDSDLSGHSLCVAGRIQKTLVMISLSSADRVNCFHSFLALNKVSNDSELFSMNPSPIAVCDDGRLRRRRRRRPTLALEPSRRGQPERDPAQGHGHASLQEICYSN